MLVELEEERGRRRVAELQGLYGPFSFSEKLLQKIWLRGDFDHRAARTSDGRSIRVVHPGKWNLLGGPDFKGARVRIGDVESTGDVELHLHARDWDAHRHAADRAYDGVILHVVLFPPDPAYATIGAGGSPIAVLTLLPLLLHDLEEYAADDVVEGLANRSSTRAIEELGALGAGEAAALIRRFAEDRWRLKVRFAGVRCQRLGWESACHHAALEILGYRFNRAAMLRVAGQYPLERWASGRVTVEDAYASETGWSLQGVRPANHPRTRLNQYAQWAVASPDWPQRLESVAAGMTSFSTDGISSTTAEFRRRAEIGKLRETFRDMVVAGAVGGTRLDNLVCDGFWPLLSARLGSDLGPWWFHWFAGDMPTGMLRSIRVLGIASGRAHPTCHGAVQGLLGWMIERENRDQRRPRVAPGGRGA